MIRRSPANFRLPHLGPITLLPPCLSSLFPFLFFSTKPKWNTNHNLLVSNPDLALMESCTSMSHLKQIHARLTCTGLITHRFPASRVIAFCALSDDGCMDHALLVFSQVTDPNAYIWNTMIRGHARRKEGNSPLLALGLLRQMVARRVRMDGRSFVFGLKAAEQLPRRINGGEGVHCLTCKMGFLSDLLVRNGLMHFYAKKRLLQSARELFDESPHRDVISWTTLIDGYARAGFADESLRLFFKMLFENVEPNDVTMIAVLSACSKIGILSVGRLRQIHRFSSSSSNLLNCLIDMYGKCGYLEAAREVFDGMKTKDVFSWTSMINVYAKCGALEEALRLFDEMPHRNTVSWSAIIAGCVNCNQPELAIEMFHRMITSSSPPILPTLLTVLSACSKAGRLDVGERIYHQYVIQERFPLTTKLANAFLDMYGKCGAIDSAAKLFDGMPERDLVSWNTMILGYAVHGLHEEAISHLNQMVNAGISPDSITFVGVLSACAHGGLTHQGLAHFDTMVKVFNIPPKAEHYTCMIDLFGRVGLFKEIKNLMTSMPMEPDKAGWGALLSACRTHKNVELGRLSAQKLLSLDSGDSGAYSVLSNVYADAKKWESVAAMRRMMKECGVKKVPGRSSIEVEGKLHEFLASDRSHLLSQKMYDVLDEIYLQLKFESNLASHPPSLVELHS